jgi:hypothetical protein
MHLLAVQKFNEIDFKIADHPAFSPHLTPFSHYLFSNLKIFFERVKIYVKRDGDRYS